MTPASARARRAEPSPQAPSRHQRQSAMNGDCRVLTAKVLLDRDFVIGETDPRLFGAFVEHLGRCVYGGIFEPGHPKADEKRLPRATCWRWCASSAPTIMRYPGGNFVSGYNWEDGVGPVERAAAPARSRLDVDRAEHVRHQRVHRLVPGRRHRADARRQSRHARPRRGAQPRRVLQPSGRHGALRPAPRARLGAAARHQVLVPRQRDGRPVADGDEDGDRIRPHRDRGRQDDEVDRSRRSSLPPAARPAAPCRPSAPGRTPCSSTPSITSSTSRCTPISTTTPATTAAFLASPDLMDNFIEEVVAIADAVAARRRSGKRIMLSFDEWNVWYRTRRGRAGARQAGLAGRAADPRGDLHDGRTR